jgi:phosphonate transport system ATP-binding protein
VRELGLTKPDDGTITVHGTAVAPGSSVTAAAMVFQKIYLVSRHSVLDNVCAGALGRLPLRRSWSTSSAP